MQLDYLAHSCFCLAHKGRRVVFDPYDSSVGYPRPSVLNADFVVVSHDHADHNAVSTVSGRALIVRGASRRQFGDLEFEGRLGRHGTAEDSSLVVLHRVLWDGFAVGHFGDLGGPLDAEQREFFGHLDLLLIPVGGGHALMPEAAAVIVKELRPKVAVPMHFKTPYLAREGYPGFQTERPFLDACQSTFQIEYHKSGRLQFTVPLEDKAEPKICVLTHQMG